MKLGMAAVLVSALLSSPVAATPPLLNRIEFENETTSVWPVRGSWLPLPASDKLQDMRRAERCSAIGGPKGRWRVSDGKLWLVGLYRCGGDVPLQAVYGGTGEPVLADWVTADLVMNSGARLCSSGSYGLTVYETTVTLRVVKGLVEDVTRKSNADHPAVPKDSSGGVPRCLRIEEACLTSEQRAELAKRTAENRRDMARLKPLATQLRDSKLAHESAVAALQSCEQMKPNDCQNERDQASVRLREWEVAGKSLADTSLTLISKGRAIRAEYPTCEKAR